MIQYLLQLDNVCNSATEQRLTRQPPLITHVLTAIDHCSIQQFKRSVKFHLRHNCSVAEFLLSTCI